MELYWVVEERQFVHYKDMISTIQLIERGLSSMNSAFDGTPNSGSR